MKKIVLAARGRFGFLKIAPLFSTLAANGLLEPVAALVVGDGEPEPEAPVLEAFGLGERLRRIPVEAGSPVVETASLMLAFERLFAETAPDFVVPGGYDNAAVAAAISASRMGIPVVSLEAGLRSYDRSDPEELNRLLIDSVAAMHFVSEHSGVYNLINEGFPDDRILFAGNPTIDSLVALIGGANRSEVLAALGVEPKRYATVLLDMPLRTETSGNRELLCRVLEEIASSATVLLPCGTMPDGGLQEAFGSIPGIRVLPMPGTVDLLRVLKESAFVLTDSEEFEAELTVMSVPCLSLRQGTCRPSTVEVGTNVIVGYDEPEILERAMVLLSGKPADKSLIPEKWDGASAKRIAEMLERAG